MSLAGIRKANPGLVIHDAADPAFLAYGRILPGAPFAELAAVADRVTAVDQGGNRYVASLPALEEVPASRSALRALFGGVDLQVGYCNGPNSLLNALEYHKSAEVDIAVTDLVLLLGLKRDIGADWTYDSRHVECFHVEAGTALVLDPEVLHFSPCRALEAGFKSVIVLPRGTNEPLAAEDAEAARGFSKEGDGEARALFMRNKWLLAHPERAILVQRGAWPGIRGENIEIAPDPAAK